MAGLTGSSNGAPRRGSARASVLVGLLAVASLPAAVAGTRWSDRYELLHAGVVTPLTLLLGLAALSLGRRAREQGQRSLLGNGSRGARLGRALGVLAVLLALMGAGSIGVYAVLTTFAE